MRSHYRLLALKLGKSVHLDEGRLSVDLNAARNCLPVTNDAQFQAALGPETYFWLSGGGTYLINNRHVLIVRRSTQSRINAGKYSLFTGRADNELEHRDPGRIVRELFEELILFAGDRLWEPTCAGFESIISPIYSKVKEKCGFHPGQTSLLPLQIMHDFNKPLRVRFEGQTRDYDLDYHISGNRDINVLFLFSAQVDVNSLRAMDGEHIHDPQGDNGPSREIFLYDPLERRARGISKNGCSMPQESVIDDSDMTEHLLHMVSRLRSIKQSANSERE